ncbi:MAG: DegV family protein [Gemmatimonadota bacterium]
MQIRYLDGPRLRRSLIAACDYAQQQRAELNRINVFPVPDGDTGTNLAMTVRAIGDHLKGNTDRTVAGVASEAAQGAILGARGNCGMMLSHFLLGFSEDLVGQARISAQQFASALRAGVEKLYDSLEDPVEGTILTVMRDTAAAAETSEDTDFVPLVNHVVSEARESLARTPEQLAVLKKAGVVDAGAKGFVSMLEGVLLFVEGVTIAAGTEAAVETEVAAAAVDYPDEEEQFRFCTEALVRGDGLPEQKAVREVLREMGDSLIVIRTDEVLKIHVHTDEPEEVFDYLRSVGTLVTHKAEDMRIQHDALGRGSGHVTLARRPVSIVTDSAADLPEEIVRAHGIHVVPMSLVDGDKTYQDGVDMTATQFHELLRTAQSLPTTSQPSPAAIANGYTWAAEEGEAVVAVFVSSTLSGTIGAAEAAKGQVEADVHIVDSLGNSLLHGMMALKAAELGETGTSPEEIVKELERVRQTSGILFTVRTFERMMASGRVGKGQALLGRLLGIKPILGMNPEGGVQPYGKAFGVERAKGELLRLVREQIPASTERVRFGIVHVGMPEIVDEVSEALRREYGRHVEIIGAPATPVIATHLGIGAWGLAWMVED